MADQFETQQTGLDSPAGTAYAITPHDTNELNPRPRAIYVGGAGNLVVTMVNAAGAAADVTFTGVLAGSVLPIRPTKVKTSSTASLLVALA